jgi:hypothetical protein
VTDVAFDANDNTYIPRGTRRDGVRAQAGGVREETGPLKHPNPPLPGGDPFGARVAASTSLRAAAAARRQAGCV